MLTKSFHRLWLSQALSILGAIRWCLLILLHDQQSQQQHTPNSSRFLETLTSRWMAKLFYVTEVTCLVMDGSLGRLI